MWLKQRSNDFVIYIESDEKFCINGTGEYTWARITNPSLNIKDEDYYIYGRYAFVAGDKTHTNGINCGSLDQKELNRLKGLSKKNKQIKFTNPTVINIAIWGIVCAGINTLINMVNFFKSFLLYLGIFE